MDFSFTNVLPQVLTNKGPILISGSDTLELICKEYLIIDNYKSSIFEIRYENHCSPFKQAFLVDTILAVGHEEHFYLFDLTTSTNVLRLKMKGYFGHQYLYENYFYVSDAGGLYCIDMYGYIRWENSNLGIDGVIIDSFTDNKIFGRGEWGPPGGWRDFVLDIESGVSI
jgi:hypothetical protein